MLRSYIENEDLSAIGINDTPTTGKFEEDKEFVPLPIHKGQLTLCFLFWYLAAFFVVQLYYRVITYSITLIAGTVC